MPKETPKKKKSTAIDLTGGTQRNTAKYTDMRKQHGAGRSGPSTGYKKTEQYAMGMGPRVGGSAKKSTPLLGANKKQMTAAKKMVRKGTGSGAKKRI
jgi:hypothetical protein